MLGVVNRHGLRIDVGLEGPDVKGKGWEGERHADGWCVEGAIGLVVPRERARKKVP